MCVLAQDVLIKCLINQVLERGGAVIFSQRQEKNKLIRLIGCGKHTHFWVSPVAGARDSRVAHCVGFIVPLFSFAPEEE